MRAAAVAACVAGLAGVGRADENVGAGVTAPAAGYVFDRPELLAEQRLWGVAYGARLLALACDRAGRGDAAEAWVDWQERERANILAAGRALSRHYYGRDDAPVDALAAVLGLAPALALAPERLAPACATLAEALAQPRYDLQLRREEILKQVQEAMGPTR